MQEPSPCKMRAKLWRWAGGKASWYFFTVPKKHAPLIRMHAFRIRKGFGSVRVRATIGQTTWTTSVFPYAESGSYILPVKGDVRKKENIGEGDTVTVSLEIGV